MQAFLSRIRKVYKKEDTFDAIFKDEFISSLNKSGKKDKNNNNIFNKPELSKEALEKLNNMETRIENNMMGLNIKNNSKESNNINDNIQYDENFIIENENKDNDLDQFYQNMQDNLFDERDKEAEKFNFVEEIKINQNYENKKRIFDETFKEIPQNDEENNGSGKKYKPNQ